MLQRRQDIINHLYELTDWLERQVIGETDEDQDYLDEIADVNKLIEELKSGESV